MLRLCVFVFAVLFTLVPASAAGAASAVVPASTDDFSFDSFRGDYYVSRDASGTAQLYVVETLVAAFPEFDQNKGLVRALPKAQSEIDLDTTVVSVTGAEGATVPWWVEEDDDWIYVLTGDDSYVHGTQTYTFSYTMSDVVIRYDDTGADEFYWDTVGTDHAQPVGDVAITVHVADAVAGGLLGERAACYEGPEGSTTPCEITGPVADAPWPTDASAWATAQGVPVVGGQVFSVRTGPLAADENVTVALGFAQGTFLAASLPPYPWYRLVLPVFGIVLGLCAVPVLLIVRARLKSNPDRTPVIARYAPPEVESPTLSAAVLQVSDRALAAHVTDLAVRDAFAIHGNDSRRRPADFSVELVSLEGLDEDDLEVVKMLFGPGAQPGARVGLGAFSRLPPPRTTAYVRWVGRLAIVRGYRARWPVGATLLRSGLRWGLLLCGVFLLALPNVVREGTGEVGRVLLFAALVLCVAGLLGMWFVRWPATVLTRAGGAHVHELEGIREYIRLAEADRLRAAQAADTAQLVSSGRRAFGDDGPGTVVNVYERLLPYAVLFGLEKSWAKTIRARVGVETDAVARLALLDAMSTRSLRDASVAVSRTVARSSSASSSGRSPSSSSSSGWSHSGGSSGGGHSGGGGGGGGIGGR